MKRLKVKRFMVLLKRVIPAAVLAMCLSACDEEITPPEGVKCVEREFIVTGYCACRKCCGWHRDWLLRPVSNSSGKRKIVGQTASGAMVQHGTIAAPPEYPFGTIMYVEGYGFGRVEDRGGDIKGNKLDLYFKSHKDAVEWGRQTRKVKVWILPKAKKNVSAEPAARQESP